MNFNDKKAVRREDIEPIKRVFTCVLVSVTHFLLQNKMVQNWRFLYVKEFPKRVKK